MFICVVVFFKQKTAYEMRISDWSSDVCSSDLDGSSIGTREVIDGQQRITTLQIMLLAFRDIAKALGDEGLIEDIGLLCWNRSSYQRKSDHFKVWPTNEGRDVMQSLVELGSRSEKRRVGKECVRPCISRG